MAGRRVATAMLGLAVLGGAALLLAPDGDRPAGSAPGERMPGELARVLAGRAGGTLWPPGPVGARLLRRVQLRERPGGRVVRVLGPRTAFGSRHVLAVVARRDGWLGVLSQHMPNSRMGWIPATAADLRATPYTLQVDLSARQLVVRREGRRIRRVRVAIGRTGSTTPIGRYAVTDALRMSRDGGGPYGCCALALTGRQPNLPSGWNGGDRIAIHGTTREAALGSPVSAGCVRASNRDMRWLMRHLPLGTPVRIRA